MVRRLVANNLNDVGKDNPAALIETNGRPTPKVFKLTELELEPGRSAHLTKTISLAQHTTRTHCPGQHRVEVRLVNGVTSGDAALFDVVAES